MESELIIGIVGLVSLFVLLGLGMPVGIAMSLVAVVFYSMILTPEISLHALGSTPFHEVGFQDGLAVIPVFVLMGSFAVAYGLSKDFFAAANALMGRLRGGLSMATILACAGFSAVSGSSLATAVTMGRVALPEKIKRGYSTRLASGAVAAGGTLGILIPPSTALIVYNLLTDEPLGRLFMAGILPGIVLTFLYLTVVFVWAYLKPESAPAAEDTDLDEPVNRKQIFSALGMVGIVFLVLGSIYGGLIFVPQAGALGAFLTFLLGVFRSGWSFEGFSRAVLDTVKTSSLIFLILTGADLLNPFLALTTIPEKLVAFFTDWEAHRIIKLMSILFMYVILGTFLEGFAMLVLTMGLVYPIVVDTLGFDGIWFGIMVVVILEMSLISPPLGLNVYVVKGVAQDIPVTRIFAGILPFWFAMFVLVGLLIAFTDLALFLPRTMLGSG